MASSYGDSAAALNETARNNLIFQKTMSSVASFGTIALASLGFELVRVHVSKWGNSWT